MFLYRAISFPLLLALLAAVVYWRAGGPWLFTIIASGAIAATLHECCKLVEKCGAPALPKTTALLGGLLFLGYLAARTLLNIGQVEMAQLLMKFEFLLLVFTVFGGWFLVLFGRERRKELLLRAAASLRRAGADRQLDVRGGFGLLQPDRAARAGTAEHRRAPAALSDSGDQGDGYRAATSSACSPDADEERQPQDLPLDQPEEIVGGYRRRTALFGRREPDLLEDLRRSPLLPDAVPESRHLDLVVHHSRCGARHRQPRRRP